MQFNLLNRAWKGIFFKAWLNPKTNFIQLTAFNNFSKHYFFFLFKASAFIWLPYIMNMSHLSEKSVFFKLKCKLFKNSNLHKKIIWQPTEINVTLRRVCFLNSFSLSDLKRLVWKKWENKKGWRMLDKLLFFFFAKTVRFWSVSIRLISPFLYPSLSHTNIAGTQEYLSIIWTLNDLLISHAWKKVRRGSAMPANQAHALFCLQNKTCRTNSEEPWMPCSLTS